MPYLKKTNPGTSTTALVSADQWNDFVGRVSGEILGDTSYEWNLSNPTRIKDDMLRIWQPSGSSFAIRFRTTALSASRDVIFPALTGNDTFTFLNQVQTLTNKIIDVVNNSIIGTGTAIGSILYFNGTKYVPFEKGTSGKFLRTNTAANGLEWADPPTAPPPGMPAGGTATRSGNASTKVFTIAHGLTLGTPDTYFVLPSGNKPDTFGEYSLTVDATNISITYQVAPPSGTDNLQFVWAAGYVGFAEPSIFSPTSTNVVTNKTMSGSSNTFTNIPFSAMGAVNPAITFNKVSVPSDPAAEDALLYEAEIDANNNGVFSKVQKNGVIFEVPIA